MKEFIQSVVRDKACTTTPVCMTQPLHVILILASPLGHSLPRWWAFLTAPLFWNPFNLLWSIFPGVSVSAHIIHDDQEILDSSGTYSRVLEASHVTMDYITPDLYSTLSCHSVSLERSEDDYWDRALEGH